MPTVDDHSRWQRLAERAKAVADSARDDPYDERLLRAMEQLAPELADLPRADADGATVLDAAGRELLATARVCCGEAWFGINRSEPALAELTAALALLESGNTASAGRQSLRARVQVDLGMGLVDLKRSAEAVPVLADAIDWYTGHGDCEDDDQQMRLAQALHTLGLAHADAGDHESALQATAAAVELRERQAAADPPLHQLALSRSLRNVGNWLRALRRNDEALPIRERTLSLRREAWQRSPSVAATLALAQALDTLLEEYGEKLDLERRLVLAREAAARHSGLAERHPGQFGSSLQQAAASVEAAAIGAWQAGARVPAVDGLRDAVALWALAAYVRQGFLGDLARNVFNLSVVLGASGRRAEALELAQNAVALYRELVAANRGAFLSDLAMSLNNLGNRLSEAGRRAEALEPVQEKVALYRELVAGNREAFLKDLAKSLNNLGICLSEAGRRAEALESVQEAVALSRELVGTDRGVFLHDLASSLNNLGGRVSEAGRRGEAVEAAQEAVALYRELVAGNRGAFLEDLAASLINLGIFLGEIGRRAEALEPAQEAMALHRELVAANRGAFLNGLAMSLSSLGNRLRETGRRAEALDAAQETVALYRELVAGNHGTFLKNLAASLNNLGIYLGEVGRRAEAHEVAQEAVALHRELVAANRGAFLSDLAASLNNLSVSLSEAGRRAEALELSRDAVALCRELVAANRGAFLDDLASSLNNLGNRLSEAGRRAEALERVQEAVALYRELVAGNRGAFLSDLAKSLDHLGNRLSEAGRFAEALEDWRECGVLVRQLPPSDPRLWTQLALGPTLMLDTARDLRDWHLPLLRQLTEHRELAHDTGHAALFLELQGTAAARVWQLVSTLPPSEAELVDEVVSVLVSTLHSPDLARWLQAQGAEDGSTAELARLKRDVIEADQVLDALMKRLGGGAGLSGGMRLTGGGSDPAAERDALCAQINEQAEKSRTLREALRAERTRLIQTDPRFASAFELPAMQALRQAARHGDGAALLCLLELPTDSGLPRCVGALVHGETQRTELLEFEGLHDVAQHASWYEPFGNRSDGGKRGLGAVLRDSEKASRPAVPADEPSPSLLGPLHERLRESFWRVLQQARDRAAAGGIPIERLHLCGHGLLHQLPLGLRDDHDCPGLQLLAWPGLPYLRLAAATAPGHTRKHSPSLPWLVGHDCAWGTQATALPMVAVEAALLRQLLQEHGHEVKVIAQATQVHGASAAVVLCCHGARAQSHFDSALSLGDAPLSVGRIVEQRLGPPLALLPACHAGETREDSAGNALGVAAGFLLGGTRVVAASSKAVPDVLMPWMSTLMVWHLMQGLPPHEAAQRARQQFAQMAFPPEYRAWLQRALQQALATIQPPSGAEFSRARAADFAALDALVEAWPWQGEVSGLFDAQAGRREAATRSVAAGVLIPRAEHAAELPDAMREMAAFVFVYGAG